MKQSLSILFLIAAFSLNAQSKDELIISSPLDSVVTYAGVGETMKGNCLFIKFSGDGQLFFNELASLHTQDPKSVYRTETNLSINSTSQPYWVYGDYSVFASLEKKEGYDLITIYFKAYSNPENYKIYGANFEYQRIVNRLVKK